MTAAKQTTRAATRIRIGDLRWIRPPAGQRDDGDEWAPGVIADGPRVDDDFPGGAWLVEINDVPSWVSADYIGEPVADHEIMEPTLTLLKLRSEAVRMRARQEGRA